MTIFRATEVGAEKASLVSWRISMFHQKQIVDIPNLEFIESQSHKGRSA